MPAAGDPYIAGAQPVAQLRQHAEFVMTPVNCAAGQRIRRPAPPNEPSRGGFWQGGRACTEVQRDALSFPSEGRFQLSDVRNQGIARLGECVECCGVAAFVRMRVLRLLAKGLLNCFLG